MTNQEKLNLLEEIMDLEEGALKEDMLLSNIDEWDSISLLSFMAMMDDEFGKVVKGKDIKEKKYVSELLEMMER